MYTFHLVALGFAGYALYRIFYPKLPPPGYDIDRNLDDMHSDLSCDDYVEDDSDQDECWNNVEEYWNAMTESERKELLDRELDEYYGRDPDNEHLGRGMLLWAYMMGLSQALKEKSE